MKLLLSTTALAFTLAFSAMAYADDDGHKMGAHGGPHFMEAAISKLPEKDAEQFRETLKKSHEKNKAMHEQMHKVHEDLHAIMTAPTFDKAAYMVKSKELAALHEKMRARMNEAFATAFARLPQDERTTLTEAMREKHGKHHGHDEKGDGVDNDQKPADAQ